MFCAVLAHTAKAKQPSAIDFDFDQGLRFELGATARSSPQLQSQQQLSPGPAAAVAR